MRLGLAELRERSHIESSVLGAAPPVLGSFSLSSRPAMLWSCALGSPRAFTSSSSARMRILKSLCAIPLAVSFSCRQHHSMHHAMADGWPNPPLS